MSIMSIAFQVEARNACLVLRDTESDGDVSDWDPATANWYIDDGSAIFGVQAGVDGPVRCEVWLSSPADVLEHHLFEAEFRINGDLQVEDPSGGVDVCIGRVQGDRLIQVRVDDVDHPQQIQILVDPT